MMMDTKKLAKPMAAASIPVTVGCPASPAECDVSEEREDGGDDGEDRIRPDKLISRACAMTYQYQEMAHPISGQTTQAHNQPATRRNL